MLLLSLLYIYIIAVVLIAILHRGLSIFIIKRKILNAKTLNKFDEINKGIVQNNLRINNTVIKKLI